MSEITFSLDVLLFDGQMMLVFQLLFFVQQ
jgi:hypothetical protein